MNNLNFEAIVGLLAKYAPVIIGIVQRDGPALQALISDLHSINAGQAPTAVVPPVSTTFPPA